MSESSLEFWKAVFEYGGVFLLFITFIFGGGLVITANRLNEFQEEKLRQFNKDLTAAKIELGKQEERAAHAEQAASDAALALAKFKAPRRLTAEQQGRLTAKAKPFSGTMFDVATTNAREPLELVGQIEEALAAAGWKELDWPSVVSIVRPGHLIKLGMAAEVGVTVQVEIPREEKLLGIAKSIAEALREEGIAAEAQFMPSPQANHDAIHIVVGDKPR